MSDAKTWADAGRHRRRYERLLAEARTRPPIDCEWCEEPFWPNPFNGIPQRFCSMKCNNRGRHVTVEQRFSEKTQKTDGCWIWVGHIDESGYGRFTAGAHTDRAHRWAWRLGNGGQEIPGGLFVCHSCDNRKCVRIDHLWLGTGADNTHDMISKGRAAWQKTPTIALLRSAAKPKRRRGR